MTITWRRIAAKHPHNNPDQEAPPQREAGLLLGLGVVGMFMSIDKSYTDESCQGRNISKNSANFQQIRYNLFLVKILIIEDEHRIAASLKKGLEQERYVVDVSYDGVDGFDLAASNTYDLIVLDLMLPKMDGLSICRNLRLQSIHTPILILTAKGQTEDKVDGLDCGADDYLTKPFAFEELLARIRALLRRPQTPQTSQLSVEDLTMNLEGFQVKRNGKLIELSGKEFSLLEYLMRHSEKIISKQQLIDHVWDYDANILPNTIEVYIKNLRRKIDIPFKDSHQLIHTIRGFGYRLGRGDV